MISDKSAEDSDYWESPPKKRGQFWSKFLTPSDCVPISPDSLPKSPTPTYCMKPANKKHQGLVDYDISDISEDDLPVETPFTEPKPSEPHSKPKKPYQPSSKGKLWLYFV